MTYVVCFIMGMTIHGVRIGGDGSKWIVHYGNSTVVVNANSCLKEDK